MAIDSALKRKSISGVLLPFMVVGVTPDASEPVAWRQAAGWSYSGIEAAVPDVDGFYIYLKGSVNRTTYLPGSVNAQRHMKGSVNDTVYLRGSI